MTANACMILALVGSVAGSSALFFLALNRANARAEKLFRKMGGKR